MDDYLIVLLITALVLIVVSLEIMAAVLPILIIVIMVPPEDRAALAHLIAVTGGTNRFGLGSAVHTAMVARRLKTSDGADPQQRRAATISETKPPHQSEAD